MKLNPNASELVELLKQKSNEDSGNTKLSTLIDELDRVSGMFIGLLEDSDTTFEEAMAAQQELGMLTVEVLMARWPERVINDDEK